MRRTDFAMEATRVCDGYILKFPAETGEVFVKSVIQDDESDELKSGIEMLQAVQEYFGLLGSKHDVQRIRVVRETGG